MIVSEAKKQVENLDNKIKDISKFQHMSEDDWNKLADELGIGSSRDGFVTTITNALISHKNNLQDRINKAVLPDR